MSVRIDKKEEVALRNLLYTQRGEPTLVAMKTLVESNLEAQHLRNTRSPETWF